MAPAGHPQAFLCAAPSDQRAQSRGQRFDPVAARRRNGRAGWRSCRIVTGGRAGAIDLVVDRERRYARGYAFLNADFARAPPVAVVDDDDRQLPTGEIGEVVVRGDVVMAGYWNDAALPARRPRRARTSRGRAPRPGGTWESRSRECASRRSASPWLRTGSGSGLGPPRAGAAPWRCRAPG